MIIKEIVIRNFRSYYGENRFVLSDGLTLIIGDNGDGKTTFFEALQWLFNTAVENNSIDNASEMRKAQMETGESDDVSVSMVFEHDGEKSVEKKFAFERMPDGKFRTSQVLFRGYEDKGADRVLVEGKNLIDRCFDAFIQRFSMFKGESTLNVFNNAEALKELVNKYSDVKRFDQLVKLSDEMEKKADDAYKKECRSDKRIAQKAAELEQKLKRVQADIDNTSREIKEKKTSVSVFASQLEQLEENQETTERYDELAGRLKTLKEKASRLRANISMVNKSTALLDKQWILCAFPDVLSAFMEKCAAFSKEKREQEKAFDAQRAKEVGKKELLQTMCGALEGDVAELPWDLPDAKTMEEMLHDHVCKVCGRPAPEGSDAYLFMLNKLNKYKEHLAVELQRQEEKSKDVQKPLFVNSYIEEMRNMSIQMAGDGQRRVARISSEIFDRLSLEDRLRDELKKEEAKIQDTEDEKARLLIQAGNVPEEMLQKNFADIKGLFQQKGRAETRLVELERDLCEHKEREMDLRQRFDELNPQSSQVKVYKDVYKVLEAIAKTFHNAKDENLRRFLSVLEECANDYLERLSVGDFHGEIHLHQTAEDSTEIRLFSSNGTEIKNPSGSQETVMYMSVLFAISDFTDQQRDENYPLIFDAATSSFGDAKEEGFYNVIDKIKKQCVIVTKDFISKGQMRLADIDQLTCSVYRIRKADGFESRDMATIRTIVEKIK